MSTKRTCAFCGKKNDIDTMYVKHAGKSNTYYCNEDHYNAAEQKKENLKKEKKRAAQEKAEYDAIFEQTKKIFGYDFQGYGMLKREVKNWEKLGSRKKILAYLKENEDYIAEALGRKSFEGDFNRVRYYGAIVVSKLHDFKWEEKKEVLQTHERVVDDDYVMPVNRKKKNERRKGFGE